MLDRWQAITKSVLPPSWYDVVYRWATEVYLITVKIDDWAYYHNINIDTDERYMRKSMNKVKPYTMVGRKGLIATYKAVEEVEKSGIEGCFVECGVAQGGSAALMMLSSNYFGGDRNLFLFDSFEGLPDPTEEDGFLRKPRKKDRHSNDLSKGYCLGTMKEVQKLMFDIMKFNPNNIQMIKGWFQDTLPIWKGQKIAALRLDGDWYESTKCCLENLFDLVVDGGAVIIDDYELVGCKKAVHEFLDNRGFNYEINLDGRGGCWFFK